MRKFRIFYKDKAKEKVRVTNKTFVASKSKGGKGSKNKEAGRRSAKHGKDKPSKKHRKKR